MPKKIGIILVGHGSREPHNKRAIKYFAKKLEAEHPYVRCAFMRMNKPSLQEVISESLNAGIEELIIQPVFLTRGTHVDQDIPKILGMPAGARVWRIEAATKKVKVVLSDPIGADDRVVEILNDRIKEALRA